MGSVDRQPYLTATTLDQAFLDECATNLETRLELAADIQVPDGSEVIHISDRNKYVVNAGVGTFYQARTQFPAIVRTLPEWLSTEVEFSSQELEISNVDGAFLKWMPGGASFAGWIGREVTISLGIAEQGSSYSALFQGRVTDVGGFGRTFKSFKLTARDRFDTLNISFPFNLFLLADYPHIDDDKIGNAKPVMYGDWTTGLVNDPAQVPGIVVNGADLLVNSTKKLDLRPASGTPTWTTSGRHKLQADDPVQITITPGGTAPSPFSDSTTYYVRNPGTFTFELSNSPGGSSITLLDNGTGGFQVMGEPTSAKRNVQCFISENVNAFLDQNNIWLKRGDIFYRVPATELAAVAGDNNYFEVQQQTLNSWVTDNTVDPATTTPFIYADGDLFYVQAKGKDLGAYSNNIVWQGRDLLMTVCGISGTEFDSTWDTYRDKASPAQSAIANIASRVWVQEQVPVMQYVQSMMTQVRLEMFQSRALKLRLHSLHLEDWNASPPFMVKQWDLVRDTMAPQFDERINFNRAQGSFNALPSTGEETQQTAFYRNQAAIDQTALPPLELKPIAKIVVFPNLYVEQDVAYQVQEMLKISSATIEVVSVDLTWRAMLLDLGDFVTMNVTVGGVDYQDVPMMVRSVGFDPDGRVPMKFWSMQLMPFPGYTPAYAGTVGGSTATITQET